MGGGGKSHLFMTALPAALSYEIPLSLGEASVRAHSAGPARQGLLHITAAATAAPKRTATQTDIGLAAAFTLGEGS
jgi:hypothetical protein